MKECLGRQWLAMMHLGLQCRPSRAGKGRVKGRCRGWGGGQQPICRGQEATPSSQVRSNAVGTKGQKGREIGRDAGGAAPQRNTPPYPENKYGIEVKGQGVWLGLWLCFSPGEQSKASRLPILICSSGERGFVSYRAGSESRMANAIVTPRQPIPSKASGSSEQPSRETALGPLEFSPLPQNPGLKGFETPQRTMSAN